MIALIRFARFLLRLLAKLAGLPDVIARWRQIIPFDKIIGFVIEAEEILSLTGDQKRSWAAQQLQTWAQGKGYLIPESVINFLVEEAFHRWLEQKGNQPPKPPG